MVTPDDLENIARVAREYDIPVIKITAGQRFALVGMQKEDSDFVKIIIRTHLKKQILVQNQGAREY